MHNERQSDESLRRAFQQVPIPAGLEARILSKLAAPVSAEKTPPAPVRRRVSRRMLLGLGAASAVAVCLTVVISMHRGRPIDRALVLRMAAEKFAVVLQTPGRLLSDEQPPDAFPFSGDLRKPRDLRWRTVENFLGDNSAAVAYDLSEENGSRATLFVVQRTLADAPAYPPAAPEGTAGVSVAVWQVGETLYVLVFEGARPYASYFDTSRSPLT